MYTCDSLILNNCIASLHCCLIIISGLHYNKMTNDQRETNYTVDTYYNALLSVIVIFICD